jgi:hypothetical protein
VLPIVAACGVAIKGKIHRGVLRKEAVGLQREADVFDRHHREIFRPANVRRTKSVPDDDVLIFYYAVLSDVISANRRRLATITDVYA